MSAEIVDDRSPGRWVSSCQKCLNYLYLDEKEYQRFIKKYNKSLVSLFTSLGHVFENNEMNLSMIDFFECLSKLTGIDFPLCSTCLEMVKKEHISGLTKDKNVGYVLERLIGAMTVQQKMVQQEQNTTEELSPNGNEEEHTKGETTKNQNELQKEKEELSSAIQSLREDLASVEREKMELEEVQAELERLRDAMNCVSSEIGLTLGMHSGETNRAVEKAEKDAELLRLLKGCNPLNDAFNIWFDREAITVNGMKLARVGNQVGDRGRSEGQIDWNSVNGVLGELLQVVDALHTLYGKRYGQIVLKPQGAASEVIDLTQKTSYKLCFNPKGGNRKLFQQALHLLLEEVKVLVAHCAEKFKVEVKYPIQQDAVNGCVGVESGDED
ncbi:hypothetical protein WA577_005398 [Blastocystis sp. JDR]